MVLTVRTRADTNDKHTLDVNTLIYYQNKLYSGADDGKIKVWEEDLTLSKEIQAHPCSVFSIAAIGNTLYSCSNEGTVKSWNLPDLTPKGTLCKEDNEMWKLFAFDNTLYAGDDLGCVRVFGPDDQLVTIMNMVEPVKDMIVNKNCIYTVRDLDLVITEMFPGEKGRIGTAKTIEGRAPVTLCGEFICFSSRGGKDILVHDNSKDTGFKEIANKKDAHSMIINALSGVKADGKNLLYSGGWDKEVKQWEISNGALRFVSGCNADMNINVITQGPKGELYVGGSDGHIVRMDL